LSDKFFNPDTKTSLELKSVIIGALVIVALFVLFPSNVSALIQTPEEITTITPINEKISLEKTVTSMDIPKDVSLSWGAVKGEASDYAERYPVIIQFFKGDEPVHIAQVKVKGDGSYEYKFRIRNVDQTTDKIVDIFEGKYTVKIFRVIHNTSDRI
jgi:hypothetical protein